MVSYSWQMLKKELVRSVQGPGREEWYFEEGRGRCKRGPTLYLLESQHGTKFRVPGEATERLNSDSFPVDCYPLDPGHGTGYSLSP